MNGTTAAKKIWSILDLITWGTDYLTEKKIADGRLNIELMLAQVLRLQRIQLYTSFDKPLTEEELSVFKELLKRRLTNEPLQYILGETEFMGLKFSVDTRVLIPRPETELLVEKSIDLIKERFASESKISILDIGTGSGCIAVSLAKLVPRSNVVAIDNSIDALEIAQQNGVRNGVAERIRFDNINMFDVKKILSAEKFHCIVSNPPYISIKEFSEVSNGVRDFEPRSALTDEGDGLKFYPAIADAGKEFLVENGIIGVEHAYDQSESVQKIFSDHGYIPIAIVKDYQGIKRHLFFSQKF